MKIIQLFLLLSLGLFSEHKLQIPEECEVDTILLQNVVENGWSDTNSTLNQFIIKYKEKAFPAILKIIDKPLIKVKQTENDIYPIPEMRLYKRDYWNLLSYMKYLEHMGEAEKVLYVYAQIFEGLNNIEDRLIVSLLYRMSIEEVTVISLKQALKSQRFSDEQKTILKQKLSETLLLDTKIFFETLEAERLATVRIISKNKTFKGDFEQDVLEKVDVILKSHNKEFSLIQTRQELNEYEKEFKDAKEKFLKTYDQLIENNNTREVAVDLVAKYIIFEGALDFNFSEVKRDLMTSIDRNNRLLDMLN